MTWRPPAPHLSLSTHKVTCLILAATQALHQGVEHAEELVKHLQHFLRPLLAREIREAHDVTATPGKIRHDALSTTGRRLLLLLSLYRSISARLRT